jgi:hypothetical protein
MYLNCGFFVINTHCRILYNKFKTSFYSQKFEPKTFQHFRYRQLATTGLPGPLGGGTVEGRVRLLLELLGLLPVYLARSLVEQLSGGSASFWNSLVYFRFTWPARWRNS